MHRTIFAAWLALIALASPIPALADPLEDALSLPTAGGLVGAQDAPRFAWVENAAGIRNIWTATRGQPARRLTAYSAESGLQLYGLVFSRDGASLAFVRGGDGEFPDSERLPNTAIAPTTPPQEVLVIGTEGGAPLTIGRGHSPVFSPDGRQIAFTRRGELWLWTRGEREARRLASLGGEINRLSWSPAGTALLFSENRDDHSFVGLFSIPDDRLTYLDPGLGESIEPVFSPDGRQVAFIRYLSPPPGAAADSGPYWSIRLVDIATGSARALWTAPRGQGGRYAGTRSRNLFWSRDGQLLFPWERTGWMHVYALNVGAGGEPRALTSGAFEVETFLIGPDRSSLLYAANDGDIDRRRIWQKPLSGGTATRLGSDAQMLFAPAVAGDAIGAIATDADSPAFPILLADRPTPLGTVRDVPSYVAPEAVTFRAADGLEIRAQLFRGRGPGRHPALIFVHGGPRRQMLLGFHPSGYYSNAYILNQHLAAQGYTVLTVNYRGGTGYGQAFRDAPETGREGASEYRDILAAGRWLAARSDVDPQRIGIWGGSWGGYLTALALARNSDLFAAGVDFHGVHSMIRPVPSSLPPQAQDRARQLQWESSPLGAIERWRSPVLLIHGDDDRNVDFSQSPILARELAARRIPYRELVYPNERHSFFRYDHWLESYRATIDFFDTTLMRRQPLP